MRQFNYKPTLRDKVLAMLAVLGLSFIIWGGIFLLDRTRTEPDKKGWERAVATITEANYGRRPRSYFHFYTQKGAYIRGNTYGIRDLQKGDKFTVQYDPQAPEANYDIELFNPIFDEEDTSAGGAIYYTKGEILRLYVHAHTITFRPASYAVIFAYTIHGVRRKRTQLLPENYKTLYPSLKAGNLYWVKFLGNQPERAIIVLNE